MATVEIHLREYERLRRRGVDAQRDGRSDVARNSWLRAAEHLYEAAAKSEGRLRDSRAETARELTALAQRVPSSRRGEPQPEGASGEGESNFEPATAPEVAFDDVAGHEEAKTALRLRVIDPLEHRDLATTFGLSVGGGVLLYGPPGTGKTLLARAVAGESGCAFFSIRPSEILSKWVGDAERNVARLFEEARRSAPSVIFLDEIDALCPSRDLDSSSVMSRLVPQILAELDGFSNGDAGLLFLGATNVPWRLDPAILRPGRFDERVYVGLPDYEARLRLLELEFGKRPVCRSLSAAGIAERTAGYSGADLAAIVRSAAESAFLDSIGTRTVQRIEGDHIESALQRCVPTVAPGALTRFDSFRTSGEVGQATG